VQGVDERLVELEKGLTSGAHHERPRRLAAGNGPE
jgi:hypothetical protein